MFRDNFLKSPLGFAVLLFCLSVIWQPLAVAAQSGESIQELKQRAAELTKQQKYTEALPILEKLAIAEPDNPETHFYLGFALIAQANVTKDEAARKALRIRGRNAFIRSRELGIQEPVIDALIQNTPPDGSDGKAFSQNAEAHKLMVEAESPFRAGQARRRARGITRRRSSSIRKYMKPRFSPATFITSAATFTQAEVWYQKAITIDPNRETAYRYSATPLMKQRKYDQARDRYIEAYISEPYNKFPVAGLTQWAQATNTRLAHPAIDIPTDVTFDEKGDAKINLDTSALLGGKDDGSFAWISYGATRSAWRKEKFAKTFPQEKTYRHSLAEEVDALRSVLALATSDKQVKKLSPSLEILKKLNDEGLLEAYILLARTDEGIAQDHPAYLKRDRDKLRRYVVEYVMTGGGK